MCMSCSCIKQGSILNTLGGMNHRDRCGVTGDAGRDSLGLTIPQLRCQLSGDSDQGQDSPGGQSNTLLWPGAQSLSGRHTVNMSTCAASNATSDHNCF